MNLTGNIRLLLLLTKRTYAGTNLFLPLSLGHPNIELMIDDGRKVTNTLL